MVPRPDIAVDAIEGVGPEILWVTEVGLEVATAR
jgi:hypothetical protein